MKKTILASALALTCACGTAMAQPPAPPAAGAPAAPGAPGGGQGRGGGMATMQDKDGNITKDAWVKAGRPADRFDMIDANKDGKISPAEFQALRGQGGPGGGGFQRGQGGAEGRGGAPGAPAAP